MLYYNHSYRQKVVEWLKQVFLFFFFSGTEQPVVVFFFFCFPVIPAIALPNRQWGVGKIIWLHDYMITDLLQEDNLCYVQAFLVLDIEYENMVKRTIEGGAIRQGAVRGSDVPADGAYCQMGYGCDTHMHWNLRLPCCRGCISRSLPSMSNCAIMVWEQMGSWGCFDHINIQAMCKHFWLFEEWRP